MVASTNVDSLNRFGQNLNRKAQYNALTAGALERGTLAKASAAFPRGSVSNKGLTPDGKAKKKNLPCFAFVTGQCVLEGKDCQFGHAQEAIDKAKASQPRPRVPKGTRPNGKARATDTSGSDGESNKPGADAEKRKSIPCRYYAKNECTKGADCPYSHESGLGKAAAATSTAGASGEAAIKPKAKATPGNTPRG